jgi:hypothetical protein
MSRHHLDATESRRHLRIRHVPRGSLYCDRRLLSATTEGGLQKLVDPGHRLSTLLKTLPLIKVLSFSHCQFLPLRRRQITCTNHLDGTRRILALVVVASRTPMLSFVLRRIFAAVPTISQHLDDDDRRPIVVVGLSRQRSLLGGGGSIACRKGAADIRGRRSGNAGRGALNRHVKRVQHLQCRNVEVARSPHPGGTEIDRTPRRDQVRVTYRHTRQ